MAELKLAPRYDGRHRVHHAEDAVARITAERLVGTSSGQASC
jgi:hypothetical protein